MWPCKMEGANVARQARKRRNCVLSDVVYAGEKSRLCA